MILAALSFAATLSAADVETLAGFAPAWSSPPAGADAAVRSAFAGRAVPVAARFLEFNAREPSLDAYRFVLRALGDPEAALVLVRAMTDPPEPYDSVVPRHWSEIEVLLEAVLEAEAVARDPRVAAALERVLGRARQPPPDIGLIDAAISLLARCTSPEAVRLTRALARDEDAFVRRTALRALGEVTGTSPEEDAGITLPSTGDARPAADLFVAGLGDPDPGARIEAARGVAKKGMAEPILAALAAEKDPLVVDALVEALDAVGRRIEDPARCRELASRCAEARVARSLFRCWEEHARERDLVEAATSGAPVLRTLAIESLAGRKPGPARTAFLLASATDVLGTPVAPSTWETALETLWSLTDEDASRALAWTDAIPDRDLRYTASARLHPRDPEGYAHYRRTRELAIATLVALGVVPFLFVPGLAVAARVVLAAVAVWGFTTFLAAGPLALPPWPYVLSRPRLLLCIAAAFAAVVARGVPGAIVLSILGYLGLYGLTRWGLAFYPPDTQAGYVFIFEPLTGAILAPVLGALLFVLLRDRAR